jgi:hypothetical protein
MNKRTVLNKLLDITSYILNFILRKKWFNIADKLMKFRKKYIIRFLLIKLDELEKINGKNR